MSEADPNTLPDYGTDGDHDVIGVFLPVGYAERATVATATLMGPDAERMGDATFERGVRISASRDAFIFGVAVLEALAKRCEFDAETVVAHVRAAWTANNAAWLDDVLSGDDAEGGVE